MAIKEISKKDRVKEISKSSATNTLLPFALTFPLLCIAFNGCWDDGCQGALNAQSSAIHTAYEAGGWAPSPVEEYSR